MSSSKPPQWYANTSFKPCAAPPPQKMTAAIAKRKQDAELAFIHSLARTTNVDGWTRSKNWNSKSIAYFEWEGLKSVSVSTGAGRPALVRVDEVRLGSNNLKGFLPSSFMWRELEVLSLIELQFNAIGGPLPSLASLRRLIVIDMRGNYFEGSLPEHMPLQLQRLLLRENRFEGLIPQWRCPELRALSLSANRLEGFAENCIDPAEKREEEKLLRDLADPRSKAARDAAAARIGALNQATNNTESIRSNGKAKNYNAVFALMPQLEFFEADSNNIRAQFNGCFGRSLPVNLTSLNFSSNKLWGKIGDAAAGAIGLRYICLSNNQLTGPVPESIASVSGLKQLFLGDNCLSGPFPRTITRLRHLELLSLRNNDIEGPLDDIHWGAELGPEPRHGDTMETKLFDESDDGSKPSDSPKLGGLKRTLSFLDLSNNPRLGGRLQAIPTLQVTSDDGSDALAAFGQSLRSYNKKHRNRVIRKLSDSSSEDEDQFEDEYDEFDTGSDNDNTDADNFRKEKFRPRRISALSALRVLDLSGCGLIGIIPRSMSRLVHLERLVLDGNKLSGKLPKPYAYESVEGEAETLLQVEGGLRRLHNLTECGLSRNFLQGKASAAVKALPKRALKTVRLHDNKFEERRPRIRRSDLSSPLGKRIANLAPGNLVCFTLYGNDIGRAPKGTGERGRDSDDEDDSDGEGGMIDPALKRMMDRRRKARKKQLEEALQIDGSEKVNLQNTKHAEWDKRCERKKRANNLFEASNEDNEGRPIGLTRFQLEQALTRQRYCIHHTQKAARKDLGEGVRILLDPPDSTKLEFTKQALAHAERAKLEAIERPKGQLSQLRFDLEQVLLGRQRDIPDYSIMPHTKKEAIKQQERTAAISSALGNLKEPQSRRGTVGNTFTFQYKKPSTVAGWDI